MAIEIDLPEIIFEESEETADVATPEHSLIVVNIVSELRMFLKTNKLGLAFESSTEYRYLPKKAGKGGKEQQPYRQPDVSFVSQARLPANLRDYFKLAPDLVVEVASPNDKDFEIELKIKEYQNFGVKLVWLAHPISRRVDVYRLATGLKPQIFIGEEELDGETILPGFKLAVSTIFDYPQPPDSLETLVVPEIGE